MSTYGGDSWVPENLYKKRRVNELLSDGIEEDEVKKLSNGSIACLVCPHCPVLDTLPMLQLHRKGVRHLAAAAKRQEKRHRLQEEIQKRLALTQACSSRTCSCRSPCCSCKTKSSPLLAATINSKRQILANSVQIGVMRKDADVSKSSKDITHSQILGSTFSSTVQGCRAINRISARSNNILNGFSPEAENTKLSGRQVLGKGKRLDCEQQKGCHQASGPVPAQRLSKSEQLELHARRQRELKFRESGWMRDGLGNWFKDDTVEFDSDEETPDL